MSDFVPDTPQVLGDSHGTLRYLAAAGQPADKRHRRRSHDLGRGAGVFARRLQFPVGLEKDHGLISGRLGSKQFRR